MEIFKTDQYYIFVNGEHSLWWDRYNGELTPKSGWDLVNADDPQCIGICHGIIGKLQYPNLYDQHLIIIKECSPVGHLYGNHVVYKIKQIALLQLGPEEQELNFQKCQKHKVLPRITTQTNSNRGISDNKTSTLSKTWGTLKFAGNTIKNTTQQAASIATAQIKQHGNLNLKDRTKTDKRINDEFLKIFTDTDSFYFCRTGDITNTLQRQVDIKNNIKKLLKETIKESKKETIEEECSEDTLTYTYSPWRYVDDRFFWNKHMLKDLIDSKNALVDNWILPIIQGFVQIEHCKVDVGIDYDRGVRRFETFTLTLISRRSRFRAGTRYKRRGVDSDGNCANYVETEQIVTYHNHQVSFVQVRGSVPVYWSQPGYKYRPPPRLDKDEDETQQAFAKHFTNELKFYGRPVNIINLIEQTGKESIIFDAYSNHILKYNNPHLTYITFDFHEYCRGMHFEKVSVLVDAIVDLIKDMNYCWVDNEGQICSQNGVFRVNCIDCLDRTNIVQTALGKAIMEIQFTKLGLISPEGCMPLVIRNTLQTLWANNGDIISRQYAGTNALKGDYTRTGKIKITGIMRDGMNSANRYYLSRFKDAYRQAAIDIMLGNQLSEDIFNEKGGMANEDEDNLLTAEHVKMLIDDSKKMLIADQDTILGSWGLIDADPTTGDPTETEIDTLVFLTKDSYYVAAYDEDIDKITKCQRVALKDIQYIELGRSEMGGSGVNVLSALKLTNSIQQYCIRINYNQHQQTGFFHMFRSANIRFFNNMAVIIKSEEELIESLKAICEAFQVALQLANLPEIPFYHKLKLDRRKSKLVRLDSQQLLNSNDSQLLRNSSETQLESLKKLPETVPKVTPKIISSIGEQFNKKLKNRFSTSVSRSHSTRSSYNPSTKFSMGEDNIDLGCDANQYFSNSESSGEDDDISDRSIFQPQEDVTTPLDESQSSRTLCQMAKNDKLKRQRSQNDFTFKLIKIQDMHLPNIGIIINTKHNDAVLLDKNKNTKDSLQQTNFDDFYLTRMIKDVTVKQKNPKITFNVDKSITRQLSTSTSQLPSQNPIQNFIQNECKEEASHVERSTSAYNFMSAPQVLNITQSQSESALKQEDPDAHIIGNSRFFLDLATSKSTNITNVLSPLSKLAKGVQSFGVNLDQMRRKSYVGNVGIRGGNNTVEEYENYKRMQELWQKSNTKYIAL